MHEMSVRVYYEDTDFGGVVYYANYLKFIERGRTELLRDLGVDQLALKAAGLVFVVRSVNIDYLAPARFDDVLRVTTRIDWVKRASAAMYQQVWRGDTLLVRAGVTVACLTDQGRPGRLPTEIRSRFVEFCNEA